MRGDPHRAQRPGSKRDPRRAPLAHESSSGAQPLTHMFSQLAMPWLCPGARHKTRTATAAPRAHLAVAL
jgi:hypothetical protein